ncbi:MAG: putative toxin-antitoxin system toxin component, PIN family [Betaproteobacteria bacterium]
MTSRLFIVDTNVLVAGLITSQPSSPTVQVLDAMLDGRLLYLLSSALLKEYRQVLLRPKLARRHGLSESEVDRLLTELAGNALWREPNALPHEAAPDPGDDHLWALLASEPGAVLVTGDELLLNNSRANSTVITESACAALLG